MNENKTNINWFPGHMKKTKELILKNLKLVDIVIEIVDARVPMSSKNPDIDELIKSKPKLLIVNKVDLADQELTKMWKEYYINNNIEAVFTDSTKKLDKNLIIKKIKKIIQPILEREKKQGRRERSIRLMIVGIPNVGKSTFINQVVKRKIAQVGNKPGVTRGKQWIRIDDTLELLDMPGVLWPKFEDQTVGIKLACIGTINSDILDMYSLSLELISILKKNQKYSNLLKARYKIDYMDDESEEGIFVKIANKRGFKTKNSDIDIKRTANTIIDEFKNGKIGKITLDTVYD